MSLAQRRLDDPGWRDYPDVDHVLAVMVFFGWPGTLIYLLHPAHSRQYPQGI